MSKVENNEYCILLNVLNVKIKQQKDLRKVISKRSA